EADFAFSDCCGSPDDRGDTVSPGWKIFLVRHALDDNVLWPLRGTDQHFWHSLFDIEGTAWERPWRLFIVGRVQPDHQRHPPHVRLARADNLDMEYAWVLQPSQRAHFRQDGRVGSL